MSDVVIIFVILFNDICSINLNNYISEFTNCKVNILSALRTASVVPEPELEIRNTYSDSMKH